MKQIVKQIILKNNKKLKISECLLCSFKDNDKFCNLIKKNVSKSFLDYSIDDRCELQDFVE